MIKKRGFKGSDKIKPAGFEGAKALPKAGELSGAKSAKGSELAVKAALASVKSGKPSISAMSSAPSKDEKVPSIDSAYKERIKKRIK
jgi:hypothetical protein